MTALINPHHVTLFNLLQTPLLHQVIKIVNLMCTTNQHNMCTFVTK